MVTLSPRKRAFTLIELLIVITIIGILAVALVPRLTGASGRARDATRKTDLQQIAVGLEYYASDYGGYPAASACVSTLTLTGLTTVPNDPQSLATNGIVTGGCATGYGYIALQSTASGYAEGYLLVSRSESTSEIGETGIFYTASTTTAWSPTVSGASATAAANITSAVECNAAATGCTSTVARFYMVAR